MEVDDRKSFSSRQLAGSSPKLLALGLLIAAASASSPATADTATAAPQTSRKACAIPQRAPSLLQASSIEYPEIAREGYASGTSVIRVDLDASGKVAQTSVLQSSGNTWLDREATRVSRESRYATARANCEDVPTSLIYEVVFDPS